MRDNRDERITSKCAQSDFITFTDAGYNKETQVVRIGEVSFYDGEQDCSLYVQMYVCCKIGYGWGSGSGNWSSMSYYF